MEARPWNMAPMLGIVVLRFPPRDQGVRVKLAGEHWLYCYPDDAFIELSEVADLPRPRD
jgi:hypothetical protein